MTVEDWLNELLDSPSTISPALCDKYCDEDKENQSPIGTTASTKKRQMMQDDSAADQTPRPPKRQRRLSPSASESSLSLRSSESGVRDDVESHKSGRMSPTKQMMALEDLKEPVVYYDFGETCAQMKEDVEEMRATVQRIADGIGILGRNMAELDALLASGDPLRVPDATRFKYPWTIQTSEKPKLGSTVPLRDVQALVDTAIKLEKERSHEDIWNQNVHWSLLNTALASSIHGGDKEGTVELANLKTASVDPRTLAPGPLPKRVVDYGYVLKPDPIITSAWQSLLPLPGTSAKSWNSTTTNHVRRTPIAVHIETKAPDKSWTDGKPQLGVWTAALLSRLRRIPRKTTTALHHPHAENESCFETIAIPLVIAQGHDWHLLIMSQVQEPSVHTIIWQKIDIGNTRNCFDVYKIVMVLQYLIDWAERVWRPWFHGLLEGYGDEDGERG